MADPVLPPPTEQMRPWYCAGPRAAESETWQSLAVSLPDDPSIPVDVTPLVAAHFDSQDVSYYSLKAWLQWTEEGQHYSLYIQHYRLHQADHASTPHNQWGPLKLTRIDSRVKQLRMTLADGTSVPVYGTTGSYMIHESGATVHAANKHAARMSHHISFHEEADLKKEHFAFSLDRRLLQQGEGYIGRTMPPQPEWTAQPSSAPSDHQDHKCFATTIGMTRRVCRCSCANFA